MYWTVHNELIGVAPSSLMISSDRSRQLVYKFDRQITSRIRDHARVHTAQLLLALYAVPAYTSSLYNE